MRSALVAVLAVACAASQKPNIPEQIQARGPAASDAEYLRRVTLDLDGRIPTVEEVRA